MTDLKQSLAETYLLFRKAGEQTPVGPIVAATEDLAEALRSFGLLPEEAERAANRITEAAGKHDGHADALTLLLMAAQQARTIIADHTAGVERTAWPEVLTALCEATVKAEKMYRYRWQEGQAEPCEVWGDARSIEKMAMKLELPERPFRAEVFDAAGNQVIFPLG